MSRFRNIFIVESRAWRSELKCRHDAARDLVLTLDFGLKHEISSLGGRVDYLDHLCPQSDMEANNLLAGAFFRVWHHDRHGKDIFEAQGIPFGFAFRIEMWSEFLGYVRLRASLEQLRGFQYDALYVGEATGTVGAVLHDMGLPFVVMPGPDTATPSPAVYFFDIQKYMRDALHGRSMRTLARNALVGLLATTRAWRDRLTRKLDDARTVFIQVYHPTKRIVEHLQQDPRVKLVSATPTAGSGVKRLVAQRMIPLRGSARRWRPQAERLLGEFRTRRCAAMCLQDGTDISDGVYQVIERQIRPVLPEALRILSSVLHYVEREPIQLEVMIANIGLLQTIVDCVLKSRGVPSYLIINGLMTGRFCDEARYATVINGYSESIKRHYYDDAEHVVCLGDPRMDGYVTKAGRGPINRARPTVSIGASGFNNLDLNSYVAVEFDFMFDVLSAFQALQDEGGSFELIIKVRMNGVLDQYMAFAKEYFPRLAVDIVRSAPMSAVLYRTDLYISIYSQTVFEASCLGIPVIYYKKDTEIVDPPFDRKSEIVTVDTIADLKQAFRDYQAHHVRFDAFLDKSIMEKYVGPLDGGNLERNLRKIYAMLEQDAPAALRR